MKRREEDRHRLLLLQIQRNRRRRRRRAVNKPEIEEDSKHTHTRRISLGFNEQEEEEEWNLFESSPDVRPSKSQIESKSLVGNRFRIQQQQLVWRLEKRIVKHCWWRRRLEEKVVIGFAAAFVKIFTQQTPSFLPILHSSRRDSSKSKIHYSFYCHPLDVLDGLEFGDGRKRWRKIDCRASERVSVAAAAVEKTKLLRFSIRD